MWYKDSNGNWCLVSVDQIRSSDARHQLFWIKDEDGDWVSSSSLNIYLKGRNGNGHKEVK